MGSWGGGGGLEIRGQQRAVRGGDKKKRAVMCMHENVIIKVRPLYANQKFILKMEKNGIGFLTREEQSSERTLLGGGGG